jgi:broad specificity phosphatase PhoE
LAKELRGHAFTAIYNSDLRRAHETAQNIAAELELQVTVEPHMREINLSK